MAFDQLEIETDIVFDLGNIIDLALCHYTEDQILLQKNLLLKVSS